jgi:TRAP-type C4-dicarboxylate transport system permease large subunit
MTPAGQAEVNTCLHHLRAKNTVDTRNVSLIAYPLISPPEGINLYVIHDIRKIVMEDAGEKSGTIMDLWIGVLPFILGQAIVIALLVAFPSIALWLPNVFKSAY